MSDIPAKIIEGMPYSKKEAVKMWEAFARHIVQRWQEIYQKWNKSSHVLAVATNILDGGDCPKCNKPWVKVEQFIELKSGGYAGYVRYFEPDCYCFVRCPKCGEHLYEEELSRLLFRAMKKRCHCGHKLWDGDRKQWGESYENQLEVYREQLKLQEDV